MILLSLIFITAASHEILPSFNHVLEKYYNSLSSDYQSDQPVKSSSKRSCIIGGKVIKHKNLYKPTSCRVCICVDGETFCEPIECAIISCAQQYTPENECCPVCGSKPVDSPAWRNPQEQYGVVETQALCPVNLKTIDDLPSFNFLDIFNFTSEEKSPIGVHTVDDDVYNVQGYKVTSRADLSAVTKTVLPGYLPNKFAFIAHVRFPTTASSRRIFNIWQVNDEKGKPMHGVRFSGAQKRLELFTKSGVTGEKITVPIQGTESVFDNKWHQIGISIQEERIQVYIDCDEVSSVAFPENPDWGVYRPDSTTELGKRFDRPDQTASFEITNLVLHCDHRRIEKMDCRNLPAEVSSINLLKNALRFDLDTKVMIITKTWTYIIFLGQRLIKNSEI